MGVGVGEGVCVGVDCGLGVDVGGTVLNCHQLFLSIRTRFTLESSRY